MKIHIEIGQYEFVEIEGESVDELESYYLEVKNQFKTNEGLKDADWRKCLDGYLRTGKMEAGDYEEMNQFQKGVIQEIKKSLKRNI